MNNEEYFTVKANGTIKVMTQDYKSAYDAYLMQKILGNDPVMKQGNKIIMGKKK